MSEAVIDKYNADGTLNTREKSSYEYDMRSFRVNQTAETWNEDTGEFDFKSDTEFLVSHRNHTGYAQSLRETTANADGSTKVIDYTFGADEVAQRVVERDGTPAKNITSDQTLVFGHDGHGSVRVLYDLAATTGNLIAQIVTYSSYGVQIAMHSGDGSVADTTLSSLGYSGEHFDASIQKSFNRARWYDANSGQWNRLDPFSGNNQDPQSLHKYAYVHGDPINTIDPRGESALSVGVTVSISIGLIGVAANRFLATAEAAKHEFYKNRGSGTGGKDVSGAMLELMGRMRADWSLLHIDKKADLTASLGRSLDWRQINITPTLDFNLGLNRNAASGWDVIQLASPLEQQLNFKTKDWFPRSVTVNGDVFYAHDVNYFFFGYLHGLAYQDDHNGTTASAIDLNSIDMLEAGNLV